MIKLRNEILAFFLQFETDANTIRAASMSSPNGLRTMAVEATP